jgi:O-antigen/teichoic acid export membrane protein
MTRPAVLGQLRRLSGHSLIYGSADVASNVVNLALTPVYVAMLDPDQKGILAILFLFSAISKILFRMGLEAGFFRIYYDLKTDDERRCLTGTVALFGAVAGAALFLAVWLSAPYLAQCLFTTSQPSLGTYVRLVAADVFIGTFLFIPLVLLRIRNQPGRFAAFVASRNLLNTVLKVGLLLQGRSVAGVLWSDLLATTALAIVLAPILIREASGFSWSQLRAALSFGLPRVPHGLLVQVLNLVDRPLVKGFLGLAATGQYDNAYTLGAGVKFVLSAFEPAWQPFVYSHIGREDAPRVFARLVTYIWAVFLGIGLAVAALGRELLVSFTFTNPAYWVAASVVPVVSLAYTLHGAFLLTSIGINIAKKTRYYPIVTAAAGAVNVCANLLLIPRWGMMGAAWATVYAYAVMAGLGFYFSRSVYPIPFEAGRLARLTAAAAATYALTLLAPGLHLAGVTPTRTIAYFALELVPQHLLVPAAVKVLLLGCYPALAIAFGVLRREEWVWLRARLARTNSP